MSVLQEGFYIYHKMETKGKLYQILDDLSIRKKGEF